MRDFEIISFHPGKQHNIEQAEQLNKYFTSILHITSIAFSKSTINKLRILPAKFLNEIDKRSINEDTAPHIDTYPWLELVYKWKRISGQAITSNFFKKRNRLFQKYVLKKYAPPKIFIGFDTSSELIFEKWKGKSILVLDLTIAVPQYKKKLAMDYRLSEGRKQNLTKDDEVWYETYQKEVNLADFILCGSDFVKQSCIYIGADEKKIKVIPYGTNLKKFLPLVMPAHRRARPFKIVFVGNINYRKGADVLLAAWEKLIQKYDYAELHFYGNLQIDVSAYVLKNVFFHGFIIQADLIRELSKCQVSILPTFFEGSSYAIYQSMALGLAVITTPNCGSVIKNMKNGLLIEYNSDSQIYDTLSMLIRDTDLRVRLAETAMHDIREYSWDNYGEKLRDFIVNL
jgi:glycosyltransferase involved in cell wall biosynthesis